MGRPFAVGVGYPHFSLQIARLVGSVCVIYIKRAL
jgi:hypothetical protein